MLMMNRCFYSIILFFIIIFWCAGCRADALQNEKCDIADLQKCNSCQALKNTVNFKMPDQGEYYRGAYWNGLYAAFKLDCQQVAKELLEHKANPNLGGASGAFLANLVSKWPHKNETINRQWVDLLMKYSIDIQWKNPYTGQSAKEVVENELISVDYPKIWKMLIERKIEKGKR